MICRKGGGEVVGQEGGAEMRDGEKAEATVQSAIVDVQCSDSGAEPLGDEGIEGRKSWPPVSLQGNLDPMLLYASKDIISTATRRMIDSFDGDDESRAVSGGGHIANLGWGMRPDFLPEAAEAYIDAVHQHGRRHKSVVEHFDGGK